MDIFELSWEDLVLMTGNLIFLVALIPSIISNDKPARLTSIITAITLTIFTMAYFSLGLAFGGIATALSSIGWWILYFQKR